MKIAIALAGLLAGAALSLSSCGQSAQALQCPDPASVVPPRIGAAYVAGLTARLAGPDRANSITGAISEMRRLDPAIGADGLTNILIVADCPNALAKPAHDDADDRARIAMFRAQVDYLLGNGGTP